MNRMLRLAIVGLLLVQTGPAWNQDAHRPAGGLIRSVRHGPWSSGDTWEGGKVPGALARVQVRPGHIVTYDVANSPVIRFVHVGGTLTFARDRDTCLNVCLLKIQPGEDAAEDGFDCHGHLPEIKPGTPPAALLVGTADEPILAEHSARISLTYINGLDRKSLPALVCCAGRMDIHGAPLSHSWVKLGADAAKGSATVTLAEPVTGWRRGDKLVITATRSGRGTEGTRRPGPGGLDVFSEERVIQRLEGTTVTLNRALEHEHLGSGEFRGAIANLSRNVVVESARPDGVRGHTMYHRGSSGSISHAEFRHLGKEGVLGRYAIHYHLCGNSMRGSYVQGCSIWDSHNRWVTIHGTNFMVVRDCVGYRSVGHGFFLEDGTEIYNVLDRNLAIQAFVGKPLPRQALPFDANDGAGFWWSNCFNSFTRNVACENDRYGFRFEATPTPTFRLDLSVRLPDDSRERVDIRGLPFVRFDDNEAHCDGKYGFNMGEGVERIGPDRRHPFVIRNMKIWEVHYAFRPQSPCMLVENMHISKAEYGLYHPNYDHHVYRNLTISDTLDEPFNRGHDDDSVQYGSVTVDGLTFVGIGDNEIPLIQLTDDNASGRAETHIRNVKVVRPLDNGRRDLVNLGGGVRPDPRTPTCVPVYLHDYFGPGSHAKVVSVKSRHLRSDGLAYKSLPPLTGDASRVAEVKNVAFPKLLDPVDEMYPGTIVTHVTPAGKDTLLVRGTTIDNGDVKKVLVNGQEAQARRPNFAEWEVTLTGVGAEARIEAHAEDAAGNVEPTRHRLLWKRK